MNGADETGDGVIFLQWTSREAEVRTSTLLSNVAVRAGEMVASIATSRDAARSAAV